MANIRVHRRGYRRRGYRRKDGTKVAPARVPATTFLQRDPGRPGRRAFGAEAGPRRGDKPLIRKQGALGGPGFATKSQGTRHRLLAKSVECSGYRSTLGRIGVLLRGTMLHRDTRRRLERDRRWLVRQYGGPGSFGSRR